MSGSRVGELRSPKLRAGIDDAMGIRNELDDVGEIILLK
jgi:hypothetical protein